MIERAHDRADRVGGDASVERGRIELGVTQENLDHADVDVLLEQMRGEAVPQSMWCYPLVDLRHLRGRVNGAVDLARPEMVGLVLPGEQPKPRSRDAIPVAQQLKQLRGKHRHAILASLTLLDL